MGDGMIENPENDRKFSDHPYSSVPTDSRGRAQRVGSNAEESQGVMCAEAQADGVPCFELGRRCETCELAYRWYVTWVENRHE
jgi:hypothetical protein